MEECEREGGVELLRVDRRGRVRVSRERREALLAQYDGSGQSGAAFAEWAGIKYPTFMSWLVIEFLGGARMRVQGAAGAGLAAEVLRGLGGGLGC
jgi:hypothetical protein